MRAKQPISFSFHMKSICVNMLLNCILKKTTSVSLPAVCTAGSRVCVFIHSKSRLLISTAQLCCHCCFTTEVVCLLKTFGELSHFMLHNALLMQSRRSLLDPVEIVDVLADFCCCCCDMHLFIYSC